jgi:hypothetical protein
MEILTIVGGGYGLKVSDTSRHFFFLCVALLTAQWERNLPFTNQETSFVFLKQANILLSFPIANKVKQASLCES